LGLVEYGGLNHPLLEQIAADDHEINFGLDGVAIEDIGEGEVEVFGACFAVVAIKSEVDIGDVEEAGHG
jgi:hypothetical protein